MVEWNLRMVRADRAVARLPAAGARPDWGNVRVAHCDTGYREHAALGFGANGPPVVLVAEGRDFYEPQRPNAEDPLTPAAMMPVGHGTRSASALAGVAQDFVSICPGLPLVPFRVTHHSVLNDQGARAVAAALNTTTDRALAGILSPLANVSLGRPLGEAVMGAAVDRAYEAGVIVVCAGGQQFDRVVYPAKHRRSIAVAGIARLRNGSCRPFAEYDDYARIDAWAPADPIKRADVNSGTGETGDGTTYATLHVTAAAALWLALRGPEVRAAYGDSWRRVEAFRSLLLAVQKPLPFTTAAKRRLQQRGNRAALLDCEALVAAPLPDPASLQHCEDKAADDFF